MKPKISVVVPVGPGRKIEVLESIKLQKDECIAILERGINVSKNRNRGAKKAKTNIISFTNTHSTLSENWSEEVIRFFKKHKQIDIVGGPNLTSQAGNYFGKVSGYALGSIFGSAEASSRYNSKKEILDTDEKYLTSANLSCKKSVLKKICFDESLYPGEDPKFIASAKKEGFKAAYSPNIIVYQSRRENLKNLTKQIFYYGVARPKKESLKNTIKMPSFLVPSLFVIYLALLPTFFLLGTFFLIPIFAYIFLNIAFSIYEGTKNKDFLSIFILPVVFLTIHVAYGLGFLYGFITKLAIRNT